MPDDEMNGVPPPPVPPPPGQGPADGATIDDVAALDPPFSPEPRKRYDAFVSYSHSGDGDLAPAVQRGLQRLAKPMFARRALEVFRDGTGLSVSPELWGSICDAMDGASYLVLFASPPAAHSRWVGLEIERWVATKGSHTILPVVTDGTWVWDDEAGDLDLARSTAAHPALAGVFANEPRPLFLERTDDPGRLSLKDDAFRDAIAELAAPIHGVPKDDLESDEVRTQRRVKRLARGALAGLVLLTLTSVVGGALAVANQREAVAQRDIAETEARVTRSQVLANEVVDGRDAPPDLRLLLAAHAAALEPTNAATGALLQALLDERDTVALLPGHVGGAIQVDFSADDQHVVTIDGAGRVRVWDALAGDLVSGPIDAQAVHARLSDDAAEVVAVDRDGTVSWFDTADGTTVARVEAGDRELSSLCSNWACDLPVTAVHPTGDRVLLGTVDGHLRTVWRDGRIDDQPAGAQVTGALFDAAGVLYVSTSEEVRVWDDGPSSGPPAHQWVTGSALLPNLVALAPDGRELAIVDPGRGEMNAIRRFETYADTWVESGSLALTATDPQVGGLAERIGAVALEDLGPVTRLLVGTEPRGFEVRSPQLLAFDEQGNRTVLTEQLGRPLGAVTDLDVHPAGLVAVASRSEVVRISASVVGDGRGVVAVGDGPASDQLEPFEASEEMASLAGPTVAMVSDLGDGRYATVQATRRAIAEVEQEALGQGALAVAGRVQVTDADGQDLTPASLLELHDVTAVAGAGGDLLFVGDRYGRVRVGSLSDDTVVERRISSAPIVAVAPSPDERWMLVRTAEEVVLAPTDGSGARALVATADAPLRRTAPPLYTAFDVGGVAAGWDPDGDLILGWDPDTSLAPPIVGQSPFPEDDQVSEIVVPTLPGVPASGAFTGGEVHLRIEIDDLLERACRLANRELSRGERQQYLADPDAPPACPGQEPASDDPVALLAWTVAGDDGEDDIVLRDELPEPPDGGLPDPPGVAPPPPPPPIESEPWDDGWESDALGPFPSDDALDGADLPNGTAPQGGELAVGDCLYLDPDQVAQAGSFDALVAFAEYDVVPCNQVHSLEVMALLPEPASCDGEVFESYVGQPALGSDWTVAESWVLGADGGEVFVCFAIDANAAVFGLTEEEDLPRAPARDSRR